MTLEVRNIVKFYDNAPLLQGVSFEVQDGEIVCLLGRSGSGKSTLLRIISGLEPAEQGIVLWNGRDVSSVPVHQRGFGLMFQDYALFPHRNVEQNVAFGLRMQSLPVKQIQARTQEMLELVHMKDFALRRVSDLSGGEQQRIALARSLAPKPNLLMLDEPLGALDRTLKQTLLGDLRQIMRKANIPVIYVTHDQEEAFSIADKLIMLNGGKIEQEGTPEGIYRHPANLWVANFLGLDNIIPARVSGLGAEWISTPLGEIRISVFKDLPDEMDEFFLLLLPEVQGIAISSEKNEMESATSHLTFNGKVTETVFLEGKYRLTIQTGNISLHFSSPVGFNCGETIHISYPFGEIQCMQKASTVSL